jgi:hypothetical protein
LPLVLSSPSPREKATAPTFREILPVQFSV